MHSAVNLTCSHFSTRRPYLPLPVCMHNGHASQEKDTGLYVHDKYSICSSFCKQ